MSRGVYERIINGWPNDLLRFYPESRFQFVDSTGSTNDDLMDILREGRGQHLLTVQADHQTKGRGRRGDRWEAPAGSNLLFSIALRMPDDRAIWTRLPHLTAVIVGTAVESILPAEVKLQAKWPNDLLVDGRKLAGILVETVLAPEPFAVVGVGLNVNGQASELSPELHEIATSIYECLGCESSRTFLLGLIVQGFIREFPGGLNEFDPVRRWLEERSFLTGKAVALETSTESVKGIGRGLGNGGELLLETETGTVRSIISAEKIDVC